MQVWIELNQSPALATLLITRQPYASVAHPMLPAPEKRVKTAPPPNQMPLEKNGINQQLPASSRHQGSFRTNQRIIMSYALLNMQTTLSYQFKGEPYDH